MKKFTLSLVALIVTLSSSSAWANWSILGGGNRTQIGSSDASIAPFGGSLAYNSQMFEFDFLYTKKKLSANVDAATVQVPVFLRLRLAQSAVLGLGGYADYYLDDALSDKLDYGVGGSFQLGHPLFLGVRYLKGLKSFSGNATTTSIMAFIGYDL